MANVARAVGDIAQILTQITIYPISPPCGKVFDFSPTEPHDADPRFPDSSMRPATAAAAMLC